MSERHPAKEVEDAIRYAEERGWVVVRAFGHTHLWGRLYCCGRSGVGLCQIGVWSTPRNPHGHAKRIRQVVDACRCSRR